MSHTTATDPTTRGIAALTLLAALAHIVLLQAHIQRPPFPGCDCIIIMAGCRACGLPACSPRILSVPDEHASGRSTASCLWC